MFERSIFCDWKGHSWIMDNCRPDKSHLVDIPKFSYNQFLSYFKVSIVFLHFFGKKLIMTCQSSLTNMRTYYWVINTPPFLHYFWQHQLAGADRKELIYTVAQHAYYFLPLPDCDEMLATCSPTCLINLCLKISGTCCQQE